jgi:hypothetical protein
MAIVYHRVPGNMVGEVLYPLNELRNTDAERYRELPDVPEGHRAYLQQMRDEEKPALMFVHIPHVLVAGPIDTTGLRVVRAAEPPDVEARQES